MTAVLDVLTADVLRFAVMFLLGAAVSMEVTAARFAHMSVYTPDGALFHVPFTALMLLAASRIGCLFFIAWVLHDRFGEPVGWYVPAAFVIAATSLVASGLAARSRVS